MIKGRDFIVFSDDWGRHPFSCMHLMKQFLPWNRILWVNTVGMRLPGFTVYDFKRSIEKIGSWLGKSTSKEEIPNNLTIISPVTIPFSTINQVCLFNKRSVIWKVKKEMERLGFQNPILLTTLPNAVDYIGGFGEIADIYYCVDEFSKWPGVLKDLVEKMEEDLIEKVDLIVATSEALQKTKRSPSVPTYLLTHGVDIEHFRKTRKGTVHPFLKSLRKPVIGYFGLIDGHVDIELLGYLINRKPEWSFIFVGPVKVNVDGLRKNQNAFFFPPVSYTDLPRCLTGLDVCILPYKVNELTHYSNPLKLKECLAAGKPVVSMGLPEVIKLKETVRIAWTNEEFIGQISEALSTPFDQITAEKVLEGEDWFSKAEKLCQWIEEAINRRASVKQ